MFDEVIVAADDDDATLDELVLHKILAWPVVTLTLAHVETDGSGIAAATTPTLDVFLKRMSSAADRSRLWIATAALLAIAGGGAGRRATADGLTSVALTSATVNLVLEPLAGRRRPSRDTVDVPVARQVEMPRTTSFAFGHAASTFAFACWASYALPGVRVPLNAAAARRRALGRLLAS